MDFYGDVLLELVTALGAALFLGNAWALMRRRADRRQAAKEAAVRARPGSPVRAQVRVATTGSLEQAPVGRSLGFMIVGFIVFVWGFASIVS